MPAVDTKHPVPFGRTRRWSLLGAIALAALIAIHLSWASHARRQLDRCIAAIHAKGDPILVDDFNNRPIVADEENAAIPLQRAIALNLTAAQDNWRERFDADRALSEADKSMIRSISQANSHAFAEVREARGRPKCDWGITYGTPLLAMMMPAARPVRELATLLRDEALLRHAEGDDAGALALCDDLLCLGEMAGEISPNLILHLIGLGIQSMATEMTGRVAARGTFPAEQGRAMIGRLLDERRVQTQARTMWHLERAYAVDVATGSDMTPLFSSAEARILRPMFQLDSCRMVDSFEQEMDAAGQSSYPAAVSRIKPNTARYERGLKFSTRILSAMLRPATQRPFLSHWRVRGDRRLAALALAIRLYRMDHQDKFPASLDELVPAYLPSLPVDPFSTDGRRFGYLPDVLKLYSVGENGIDEGGKDSRAGWSRSNGKDYVIDLLPSPLPPPATQPEDE